MVKLDTIALSIVAGYEISSVPGLVRGNVIRAKYVGTDIIARLRNLVGGEVVEAHGGMITLEHRSGGGLTATVTLPAKQILKAVS